MFHLRRYFSIASLLAFVLVILLLSTLYRTIALRMFIQLEENKNVELTQAFANSLWPELKPLIAMTESSTHVDLRDLPLVRDLRYAVISQMRGLSVVKVKVYDLDGHTIFSTQIDQIGENGSGNAGFQGALLGQIASELTHRDTFSAFEETIEDQDLLSTYIPIYENGPASAVVGVFELYSNVTPFLEQITTTQRLLVGGVGITLSLLYLVLLWIVSRADTIMRRQQQEQLLAVEEIRRQQRTVAVLQEREHLAREIHDSLGQVLGYVNTQAQAARLLLGKQKVEATDKLLARLVIVAQDAHVELRDFILTLQTGEQSEQSFLTRLQGHLAQFTHYGEIRTDLSVAEDCKELALPIATAAHLLRIVQEALNNVHKHAAARSVTITVEQVDQHLQLRVADDGRGFDVDTVTGRQGHWGLQNMQKRAAEIGATMQLDAIPGVGTSLVVRLPHSKGIRTGVDACPNPHANQYHPLVWLRQPPARFIPLV
jgi:signal transduction histidine kinase